MDSEMRDSVGNLPPDQKVEAVRMRRRASDSSKSDLPGLRKSRPLRKVKSLYGNMHVANFGPKAVLASTTTLTIQDPSGQSLEWLNKPTYVLVIKKLDDEEVIPPFLALLEILAKNDMRVFIEEKVPHEPILKMSSQFQELKPHITLFKSGVDSLSGKVDFIVSLGGDGTLIYASSLFRESVPPVLAFNLGSLGFLTPFDVGDMERSVTKTIEGGVGLILRSRLKCAVYKAGSSSESEPHLKDTDTSDSSQGSSQDANSTGCLTFALNEVVIDRGPSPYLTNLDLYVEQRLVTSVQGDGLIIATPTGSTAYAAATGASMVHPCVPAIVVSPICPHSLSFRPIILPAGVEITVMVSPAARSTAWVAFDGRNRQELQHGDRLKITTSKFPLPSICAQSQLNDWFSSLAQCLHWNVRQPQKAWKGSNGTGSLTTTSSTSSLTSTGLVDSTSTSASEYTE